LTKKIKLDLSDPETRRTWEACLDAKKEVASWPAWKRGDTAIEPEHYTRLKPEPLDIIESWGLAFHEAQVLKYISRAGVKGGEEKRLEDLKKAAFYLNRRIKQLGG
jgi:hypothetical protein